MWLFDTRDDPVCPRVAYWLNGTLSVYYEVGVAIGDVSRQKLNDMIGAGDLLVMSSCQADYYADLLEVE